MAVATNGSDLLRASEAESIDFARAVLTTEAEAIETVRDRLDGAIHQAAHALLHCRGSVIVTGMGKAGIIGQKLAATLASTGTRAFPLHPADAVHGDLGRVGPLDVVVALSQSGETDEVIRILPAIRRLGASLIAITERADSRLGQAADVCIQLGPIVEACPNKLAPSSSSTVLLAVSDALALLVSQLRNFHPEDFAVFHPAGTLGRKLGHVEDIMRTGRQLRTAQPDETIRQVLVRHRGARRRSGAVLVVDQANRLLGIFTDSDLSRLFENRRENLLDAPIRDAMTPNPIVLTAGASVQHAIELLHARKLSELPVLDDRGALLGLVDITDLIGLVPAEWDDAA